MRFYSFTLEVMKVRQFEDILYVDFSSFVFSIQLLLLHLTLLLLHPFSVSHLKLLLLSVDSFAWLKKREAELLTKREKESK